MSNKQKLELAWIGKDKRPKLEPRILLEDPALSYHARQRVSEGDLFDNRLIFGDNLLALKALEQELTGKVKCCFIDPPYNTGSLKVLCQKMGRRWIMAELGEHCHTHIIPRMQKVIDGEDPGGITKCVDWKGGGGFRYYRLAPSLLEKDRWGNWVINREYNARTLIEQSIGRGLRLPFAKRAGVGAADRLNIVAHDRFQEIIDEAINDTHGQMAGRRGRRCLWRKPETLAVSCLLGEDRRVRVSTGGDLFAVGRAHRGGLDTGEVRADVLPLRLPGRRPVRGERVRSLHWCRACHPAG